MMEIDEATMSEWLDLDLENELDPTTKNELDRELSSRPELAAEHLKMQMLNSLLAESRIAVRPDFHTQIMNALPEPAWQPRPVSARIGAWGFPIALVLTLGVSAAWILGGSAVGDSHALGIVGAIADLLTTTILAGSGLLFATWRGISFGIEELLGGSGWNLAVFAAGVVCINLLLYSLLRRRVARVEESSSRD